MKIRLHEKLYRDGISDWKLASIRRKIRKNSPKLNLFLVTLPIGESGILEIYWYPELLQNVYRQLETEMIVVGLADSREDAFSLVEQIITDIGWSSGQIDIVDYFKESS